jgi:hypothetical protein
MSPVNKSSVIKNVGQIGCDLYVEFKSGKTYTYLGAGDHYHALALAESAGKYFNEHIKNKFALAKS